MKEILFDSKVITGNFEAKKIPLIAVTLIWVTTRCKPLICGAR